MTSIITKDKSFYTSFFSLVFLLVLQNLISYGVNLTDNIMLGAYSQNALSGAATVNQIQFVLQQLTMGIGEGLVVLAAQYWGRQKTEPIKGLIAIAFWCGILLGVLFFAVVSIAPYGVLSLFTSEEAIIGEGIKYLDIMRYTYLIFIISNVLLAGLRSVEAVRVAFYTSICTFIINILFNYILIYGNLGAPRLGAEGSAVSTLIARSVELCIIIFYVRFYDKKLLIKLTDLFYIQPKLFRDYLHICMPVVATYGLWGAAVGIQTAILGHLDADAIAANSVSTTFYQVLKTISIGSSSAAAVVIAKTVGSGKISKVKEYSRALQGLFLCIGIFTSVLLFVLRRPLLSFYSLTPEARSLTDSFLLILCVTCIGTAYQMPVLGGIIRGGGDTKFVLVNDLISIWVIVLPCSFVAAFVFHLSPVIVLAILNSDQIFKCVVAAIKVNRYKWIKLLVRKEERGIV